MNNKLAQISLLVNGVLVIAVGVLFWLHFSSPSASSAEVKKDSVVVKPALPEIRSVNGAIAYIDVDKVLTNYKFFNDRKKQLEGEMKGDEKRIEQKQAKFKQEYENAMKAQQNYTMTEAQLQEKSIELQKMQADLDKELQAYENKGLQLENTLQKEWMQRVEDYLRDLSKEKNYSYVVTYTKGNYSAIVFANDSLNITDNVLTGLNNEYAKGKK